MNFKKALSKANMLVELIMDNRVCDSQFYKDANKLISLTEGISTLQAQTKEFEIKDSAELASQVEQRKTMIFGHRYFVSRLKTIYAISGDGSLHVEVLNGYLDHTNG